MGNATSKNKKKKSNTKKQAQPFVNPWDDLSKKQVQPWECDACKFVNKLSEDSCTKCNAKYIIIPVQEKYAFQESFQISVAYSSSIKIGDVINKIMTQIHKKYYPKIYHIWYIEKESFVGKKLDRERPVNPWAHINEWEALSAKSLTEYPINEIVNKGLTIKLKNRYTHKINNNKLTCQYINNLETEEKHIDVLKCPIYKSVKLDYKFSETNLNHLYEFTHFENEFQDKPTCKYYLTCTAFIRLENGGNRLDDRCHVKIYRHPPRNQRQITLAENMNQLLVNTKTEQNHPKYDPTDVDREKYLTQRDKEKGVSTSWKDGYIHALIEEVVNNGHKYDLCLECVANDVCEHCDYSLLCVVDDKLNHIRHKQMGSRLRRDHMLALVLYTGCDCNYKLCSSQRSGDYETWKWFDFCLYAAIFELSIKEYGSYKLYSGLNNVKLNKKEILCGYFPTYTSTSWVKEVAMSFMNGEGMLIEVDKSFRGCKESQYDGVYCCDVSWISKFPDECEILIARSLDWDDFSNRFSLLILDEKNGIQTVSLRR